MSIHAFPLAKYSLLVKSTMSFKKTFNEITDVRLEIHESNSATLKVLGARNQEYESHLINAQLQCWQKERKELWFKALIRSQIKRFKAEFKFEEHCGTTIAILEKFGIEVKRSPSLQSSPGRNSVEYLSTQAFIQEEDFQIVPASGSYSSQPMIQDGSANLSPVLLQESLSNLTPFQFTETDLPSKNWKFSPLLEEDFVFQTPEPNQSSSSESAQSLGLLISNTSQPVLDLFQHLSQNDRLVEKVLAKRRVEGTLQYLIKWSGLSKEYSSWKDYTSSWSLEDQQKALAFEKSLLEEVTFEEDGEIIPYVLDLDLIRYRL